VWARISQGSGGVDVSIVPPAVLSFYDDEDEHEFFGLYYRTGKLTQLSA
jgi:hypothetical protein